MKNVLFTLLLITMVGAAVFVFSGVAELNLTIFLIGTHLTLFALSLYGLFLANMWKDRYHEEIKRRRMNSWSNNEPGMRNGRRTIGPQGY